MRSLHALVFILVLIRENGRGQTGQEAEMWDKPSSISILDNSFLVEEAFNQDPRVVQHISTFQFFPGSDRRFAFSFTQEWPLWGMTHQFSYQFTYSGIDRGQVTGFGDVMLNYRYQLLEKESGVAVAPRFSVTLPTGDASKGLGEGVLGYEACIPASGRFSDRIVAHGDLIVTYFPHVKGKDESGNEVTRSLPVYTIGASIIYLLGPQVNLMLEALHRRSGEIDQSGETAFSYETTINPGLRTALNFENLQIVPGLSVPVRLNVTGAEVGMFFYLSFEHGF